MLVLIRLITSDYVLYNPLGILMGVRGYPDLPNSQTSMTRRFKRFVFLYRRSTGIPVFSTSVPNKLAYLIVCFTLFTELFKKSFTKILDMPSFEFIYDEKR